MKFLDSKIEGCHRVELQKHGDERGFFARLFCEQEYKDIGLNFKLAQANDSFSADKGTLRGMHYQKGDFSETKIIRCLKGAIFDVVIDLRPASKSYLAWEAFHLDEENRSMVIVPKGCAHGFMTMEENTEVLKNNVNESANLLLEDGQNPDVKNNVSQKIMLSRLVSMINYFIEKCSKIFSLNGATHSSCGKRP